MDLCSYYVTSPGMCFSTEDYNEWMNKHYHNNDDDDVKKIFFKCFYLPYCDGCDHYKEFTNNSCFHHRSQRLLVTCNYCQNNFKTFNDREISVQFVVTQSNVN